MSPSRFLTSANALWFWIIVFSSSFLFVALFWLDLEQLVGGVLIRQLLGGAFMLLYPGFSFLKAVRPFEKPSVLENLVMSFLFSVVLTTILGFALTLTPYGVTLTSAFTGSYLLIILFSPVGLVRDYLAQR